MPLEEAGEQLALWEGHLELVRRDHGMLRTVAEAVWSSVAHLGWRITLGPPSAFLPGVALLTTGVGSGALAVLRPDEWAQNLAVLVAALFLGFVLVRHPRVQPRWQLAVGTALCVPVLLAYSIAIAADIWTPSDWFIVLGTAIIAVGMAIVSMGASPLRLMPLQTGRSWGFGLASLGAGSIAVAELDWLLRWSGLGLFIAKLLAALGTLSIAFTAWRIREIPQQPESWFDVGNDLETVPKESPAAEGCA